VGFILIRAVIKLKFVFHFCVLLTEFLLKHLNILIVGFAGSPKLDITLNLHSHLRLFVFLQDGFALSHHFGNRGEIPLSLLLFNLSRKRFLTVKFFFHFEILQELCVFLILSFWFIFQIFRLI